MKFNSVIKKKNLPVIFFSNFSPAESYTKANPITLDAFIDRLTIIEVQVLYGLIDFINAPIPVTPVSETLVPEQAATTTAPQSPV